MSFPLSKLKEIIRELIKQELLNDHLLLLALDGGERPPRTPYLY